MKKGIFVCGMAAALFAASFLGAGCDQKPTGAEKPFEELASDRVTEEEWTAAFAEENFENVTFAYTVKENTYYKNSPYFEGSAIHTIKIQGGKSHQVLKYSKIKYHLDKIKADMPDNDWDRVLEEEGEGDAAYWGTAGKKNPFISEVEYFSFFAKHGSYDYRRGMNEGYDVWSFQITKSETSFISSMIKGFSFSAFTYNEEQKQYQGKMERIERVSIKFNNGKVVGLSMGNDPSSGEFSTSNYGSIVFYDYGTTTVTLPAEFQQKIDEYNVNNE